MSPRTRAATIAATLLVTLPGLVACGSDDPDSTAQDPAGDSSSAAPTESPSETPGETPTETSSTPPSDSPTAEPVTLPTCAEVWVVGARVPGRYEGCLDGETTVPADGRYCEFGKPLFTYQKNFYAVAGGPVIATERPLLRDPGYRDALKKCGG